MSVRAKFFVQSVSSYAVGNGSVVLAAATRGSENKAWAEATPSGKIEMTVNNPAGWEWFRDHLGVELYLDFTVAPSAEPHAFDPETDEAHYNRGRCILCSQDEAGPLHV